MIHFLTRPELEEITRRQKAVAMFRALDRMQIPCLVDGDGWPLVLRSNVLGQLTIPEKTRPKTAPDFASAFGKTLKAG